MKTQPKSGLLEKFGIYYLNQFTKQQQALPYMPTDEAIKKYTKRILWIGYCFITIVSIICVWPMVLADVHWQNSVWYIHYGYVALFTIGFTLIEFYLLFLITLWLVHQLANYLGVQQTNTDEVLGPFGIVPILSRTALEIPEPIINNIGIDPFKQLNKRNIFVLGLLYKLKIIVTNTCIKYLLLFTVGAAILGVSILYMAIPVEIFWNIRILKKVIQEAQVRIFGYRLAQHIVQKEKDEKTFVEFSAKGKDTLLRAIANSVVMAQNYHPNMMVLYLEFKQLLRLNELNKADSWPIFLQQLKALPIYERNAVMDTLCIAAAFDGKFSKAEDAQLTEAFGLYTATYLAKIKKLNDHLVNGEVHSAALLTDIDYEVG